MKRKYITCEQMGEIWKKYRQESYGGEIAIPLGNFMPLVDEVIEVAMKKIFNSTEKLIERCREHKEVEAVGALKVDGPAHPHKCVCANWADVNTKVRTLTGHHENCRWGHASYQMQGALCLIQDLVKGIDGWAHDCDGVPDELWPAYKRACLLQGRFVAEPEVEVEK